MRCTALLLPFLLTGCLTSSDGSNSNNRQDAQPDPSTLDGSTGQGGEDAGQGGEDAGRTTDGGPDAGASPDAGANQDAAPDPDASPQDAGLEPDASLEPDAGSGDINLHVSLSWDTPGDANQVDTEGTDLDLHLLHPGADGVLGSRPYDCHSLNNNPEWHQPGPEDDPDLDRDDADGAGPENINLSTIDPVNIAGGAYLVAVTYVRSTGQDVDYGPSDATVRIFIDGQLRLEEERRLNATGDSWSVGEIYLDDAGLHVEALAD